MTLTINHTDMASRHIESNQQRSRAVNFVNKSDSEVHHIAQRITNIKNHKKNERLAKNLNAAFNSLPVVALASGLAMKKGIKPSLKNSAEWGLAVAIPAVINKAHNSLSDKKKKSDLSFGVSVGLSLAGFFGATALLDKAAANPKVNKVVDTVIAGAKDTLKKVRSEIKVPEKFSTALSGLKSKIKIPEFAKNAYSNVMKTDFAKTAIEKGTKLTKGIVKNAPMIVALGIVGTIIGSAVKQSSQVAETKKLIKNDQLNTAKNLVNIYKQENEELKSQLEV